MSLLKTTTLILGLLVLACGEPERITRSSPAPPAGDVSPEDSPIESLTLDRWGILAVEAAAKSISFPVRAGEFLTAAQLPADAFLRLKPGLASIGSFEARRAFYLSEVCSLLIVSETHPPEELSEAKVVCSNRIEVNGATLEYEIKGSGDRVVFFEAGAIRRSPA